MATKASPLAQLAPSHPRVRACCLALPALLAAPILAFTVSGESKVQLKRRTTLYCALAFPPSQVARRAQLEAVYCKGFDADKQCQADFGWIVISEPVPCD
ncbi:MAG: hypothetical protein GEV13_00930 [Rhodospirillales bacterium]|nr:hypothetical protein [Rhodospirillales bacterium]